MTSLAKGIFIVGAKRTPFGTFGGKLAKTHITDLQVIASKAALTASNINPEWVDTVVIGNVMPSVAADGGFLARHVLLKTGIPLEKPAFAVNRLCGSGFQSIINGLQDISVGLADIALTGGVENMSSLPYIVRNIRFGNIPLGLAPVLEDAMTQSGVDTSCNLNMALTAEKLGEQFKLSRSEVDEFAFISQQRWKAGLADIALKGGVKQMSSYPYVVRNIRFGEIPLGDISTGLAEIALTGGVDNMSQSPYIVRNIRFGNIPLGQPPAFEDVLWQSVMDTYCNLPMALTAEKLGAQFKLTKDEVDAFAYTSQQRWKAANDAGKFKDEIVPVPIKEKKEVVSFEVDEHPRPWTTPEMLGKLPSIFKKDGLVTAGTASGISDGAAAVVVASEASLSKYNLKPLARIVAHSVVGVDPSIMGFGPAPAIRNILKATGKTLDDIDLIEINEAFGAQTLACAKDLKLDMNKLNVNGGAIALGHPLAASGSRITGHLVYELKRRNAKLAIGSACIGGGQGIAIMVENI